MIDLTEAVMDTDIEMVLNRIRPNECADPDYWFATVDLIEDGRSPSGDGRLTMSELEMWEDRVTKGQSANAQDQTRLNVLKDNYVSHEVPSENHWYFHTLHVSTT